MASTTSTPGNSALQQLRANTHAFHERLESRLNILQPDFSREHYLNLLRHFYGFYKPVEAILRAYGEDPAGWIGSDRRKLHLIAGDLQALGMSPAQIAQLPSCSLPAILGDPISQLGCIYVVEGSTLGGQSVVRQLQPKLGLKLEEIRFFSSYGNQVGGMWRGFCQHLERSSTSDSDHQAVVNGAVATFSLLESWLPDSRTE